MVTRSPIFTALGSTSVTLQFNLDRDIDAAALDVQSAISRVARSLPADMPGPPSSWPGRSGTTRCR